MCQNINTMGTGSIGGDCPAVVSCHDFEYFPCGCSKCRKCGLVNRCGQYQITTPYYPYGQGTGTYPSQQWQTGITYCQTTPTINQNNLTNG
jgi:hypothetical protein